ncbi:MAG: bifunctional DNA primase/polymerase [Parcubacteria group bacterium]
MSPVDPPRVIADLDGRDRLAVALGAAQIGLAVVQMHGVVKSLGPGGTRLRCGCAMQGDAVCEEPGLHPVGGDWRRRATRTAGDIRARSRRAPGQNWGAALGDASGGVIVLDVQGCVGAMNLAQMQATLGPLPATAESWWSDRRQRWLRVPPDAAMPHGHRAILAPRLAAGVTLLADADVAPLPASLVGEGERVSWLSSPTLTPIATLPFSWADHLTVAGGVPRPAGLGTKPSVKVFGPRAA